MSTLEKEEITKEILYLVEKYGITSYEIAKNTGITAAGVGKVINGGSKNPRLKTLTDILQFITKKYCNTTGDQISNTASGNNNQAIQGYGNIQNASGMNVTFGNIGSLEIDGMNEEALKNVIIGKDKIIAELREEIKSLKKQVNKLIDKL